VAGYTATELGKYVASSRVKPEAAYTVARVAGYYPLFILVQILFGAMFAFADATYNGPVATVAHALMSATLTQVRVQSTHQHRQYPSKEIHMLHQMIV
jgi:hypothetical protein